MRSRIEHLVVVGGGAAAFSAALRASDDGIRVTMIQTGLPLGGTCVNVGCIPTKFLLESMKRWRGHLSPDPWVVGGSFPSLDHPRLWKELESLVSRVRRSNYEEVLQSLGNVRLVEGRGVLSGPREVRVEGETIRGDAILLCTGARTSPPPIPGISEIKTMTNIEALSLRELPESLAIVGAGPLGVEFAQVFSRLGVGVTAVELMGRILPQHEPEISEALSHILEEEGIHIKAGCRLVRAERRGGRSLLFDSGGCVAEAERVLLATGVRGNTEGMGLERVGVRLDPRGFVVTDERGETTVPGIYAAGDVTGKFPLETVAAKQGFLAAHNAITGESRRMNFDLVPHAVFTDPEVASVGWTESKTMERLGTCSCRTLPLERVPRALAAGDVRGFVKLVVDPSNRRIVGAHALSPHASEIIHVPLLVMRFGGTLDDLVETVHTFPTYSEAWKICSLTFDREAGTMSCCAF